MGQGKGQQAWSEVKSAGRGQGNVNIPYALLNKQARFRAMVLFQEPAFFHHMHQRCDKAGYQSF